MWLADVCNGKKQKKVPFSDTSWPPIICSVLQLPAALKAASDENYIFDLVSVFTWCVDVLQHIFCV